MASRPARLTALVATLPLLWFGTPAQAAGETNLSASAATCYGGAVRSYFQAGGWGGDAGPYKASTRCKDVNVKNSSEFGTEACVVFIDKTNKCNYLTYLPAKSDWITVATNVRDGANFKVRFSNLRYEYEPLVAYHAY
ncbi:hypothetical protein FJK98_01065 [Micromonospora sp. HM134]|uniref:hypothetical protein n=1 Tax=unclassified Micromonospora TaxID=2617518 RepID=UPI001198C1F0|nr:MULTISPECIES: hypothetical protein [unclassified Micromonospora]QDY05922.1 hypothetical protein FJK98_01065 [Micromonospora sp. HM134]